MSDRLPPEPGRAHEDGGLPSHLDDMEWVEIPGMGWLREMADSVEGVIGFYWWHDCLALKRLPGYKSLRWIDTISGDFHAILGGSLAGGDLTIGGGSGSIPCHECGLHGWVRDGKWVGA